MTRAADQVTDDVEENGLAKSFADLGLLGLAGLGIILRMGTVIGI